MKKTNQRLQKMYPTGGTKPKSGVITGGDGTIPLNHDSDDFILLDNISSALQNGNSKGLMNYSPALYNSVDQFYKNPNNTQKTPNQRVVEYFDSYGNNPEVEGIKGRLKSLGTGIQGNLNSTPNMVVQGQGVAKLATGGDTSTSSSLGGYGSLLSDIPGIVNSISSIWSQNPNNYSREPIVNRNAMQSMIGTPYNNTPSTMATGGDSSNGIDDETMEQLQNLADSNGITIDELMNQLQQQGQQQGDEPNSEDGDEDNDQSDYDEQNQSNYDDTGDEYGMGGTINIKKANRGKFNALKKKTGKSTEELTHSSNPLTRKRAVFAQNAKKWKHAFGGNAGSSIEAEGGEVVQTPDGNMSQVQGPSHEDGGVDMNVPSGTKIYSDRLQIDGKTMQERKIKREKALSKLQELSEDNPTDKLLQASMSRTQSNFEAEEKQDMALQNVMKHIYNVSGKMPAKATKMASGGDVDDDSGIDGGGDPFLSFMNSNYGMGYVTEPSYNPGFSTDPNSTVTGGLPDNINANVQATRPLVNPMTSGSGYTPSPALQNPGFKGKFSVGDYTGMAGNLFNGIAPLINTMNARKATQPNVNRFTGFGHNALQDNEDAQGLLATTRTNTDTDIDTAANSSRMRNRNSSNSLNGLRALDAATEINTNKSKLQANDAFARGMTGLMGQRAELDNQADRAQMTGAKQVDTENKADTDNYYSNMAHNLTNLGTNVQGLGKAFNTNKSNKVDANLISQLSQYGIGFDDDGNLISTHK